MRIKAEVIVWEKSKGYGFAESDDGYRHFVHVSQCPGFAPRVGEFIEFELGPGRKGPMACNVTRVITEQAKALAASVPVDSTTTPSNEVK